MCVCVTSLHWCNLHIGETSQAHFPTWVSSSQTSWAFSRGADVFLFFSSCLALNSFPPLLVGQCPSCWMNCSLKWGKQAPKRDGKRPHNSVWVSFQARGVGLLGSPSYCLLFLCLFILPLSHMPLQGYRMPLPHYLCFFLFLLLSIGPRALCIQSVWSTSEHIPSSFVLSYFSQDKFCFPAALEVLSQEVFLCKPGTGLLIPFQTSTELSVIAAMKHHGQKGHLGKGEYIWLTLSYCCSSLKAVRARTQTGQEPDSSGLLKAGADIVAIEGCCLLACSLWFTQSAFS